MAVVAVKRKKIKKNSEWSRQLAGIALCSFFALGVGTGLSGSGHQMAARGEAALRSLAAKYHLARTPADSSPPVIAPAENPVALVKRADGFFLLDASRRLSGPVVPSAQGDLPIVSGAQTANSDGGRLVEYASVLVRSEVALRKRVSEIQVDSTNYATLYLDRPALPILIDLAQPQDGLERAAKVLALWRDHSDLLAGVDATVPGQTIVRLRPAAFQAAQRNRQRVRRVVAQNASSARISTLPEVTASR